MEQFDWTQIKGIDYCFHRHALSRYNDCHAHLNELISSVIPLPSVLFLEETITRENATLVAEFESRIRDEVVNNIVQLVAHAPASFDNNSEHIGSLFAESMLRYKDGNRLIPIRSTESFVKAAQKTIDEGKENIEILFSIDHWYFDKKKWTPMNFGQISLEDQQVERTSNTNPSDQTMAALTRMTNDHDAAMAKLTEALERVSNSVRGNQPQGSPSQAQNQNPIGTRNTGNPEHYNIKNIPATVKERYTKNDEGIILTSSEMTPFTLPNPSNDDPDGTVIRNYFVDGPRLITRDGTLFDLTSTDQSKSAHRDKNFLSQFPKLYGEEAHVVRKWYQEVQDHCSRANIYLHPYYLFRKEADHIRGFTIGNSESDDLPSQFQYVIKSWSVLLFTAIRSEKVIPESCSRMRQTMLNYQSGKGYETIFALISMTHPHHLRYPHDLITQTPKQGPTEQLETFYFRYVDFLRLRAYLSDQPGSLDNKHEVSCFIQGTREKTALRRKTDEERESTAADKIAKYKSGTLLRTLQMYMDEIDKERGGATRRPSGSLISGKHNQTRRSPRFREILPRKNDTTTSTITTKSINLIQQLGYPDINEDDPESAQWHGHYCVAINIIDKHPQAFDTSRVCIVCRRTGHAFDKCPVLNDLKTLQAHRIRVAQFMNNVNKTDENFLGDKAQVSQVESSHVTSVTWQDEYEYQTEYSSDPYVQDEYLQDFHRG